MKTWIVTWNPEQWDWDDYDSVVAAVRAGRVQKENWTCRAKGVERGDRIFLLRQGPEGRGIVGAGHALGVPKEDASGTRRVQVGFDVLVPLVKRLDRSVLMSGKLEAGKTQWGARFSGMSLPDEVATVLEEIWSTHVAGRGSTSSSPATAAVGKPSAEVPSTDADDDDDDDIGPPEGEAQTRLTTHQKLERQRRDQKLREARQKQGGRLVCEVPGCGFDFEARYGELGAGFAEVHHLVPLSSCEVPSATPHHELAVVCANCHRMIHRGGECRDMNMLVSSALRDPSLYRPKANL